MRQMFACGRGAGRKCPCDHMGRIPGAQVMQNSAPRRRRTALYQPQRLGRQCGSAVAHGTNQYDSRVEGVAHLPSAVPTAAVPGSVHRIIRSISESIAREGRGVRPSQGEKHAQKVFTGLRADSAA